MAKNVNLQIVWRRIRGFSKQSVFLVLQCVFALYSLWLFFHLPPPGWAVAVLSVAAVVMSLQGETRRWQKAIWMGLIGILLVVELRAINEDRADVQAKASADRAEQQRQFQAVRKTQEDDFEATAKRLEQSYAQAQQQFSATMSRANAIYGTTQAAATTAKEAVLSLTGGDSYIAITPSPAFLTTTTNAGQLNLMVSVVGKYPLWDVRIQMAETSDARQFFLEGKTPQSIPLGTVSKTYMSPLGPLIRPSADKEDDYYFWVYSRNEPTVETLRIRFNSDLRRWECAWTIWRDVDANKGTRKVLQDFPWSQMAPPPELR